MRSWLPAVLGTLVAASAQAHDADVIYVELVSGPNGAFAERITLTAATLGMLAPVDADADGELTQKDLDARRDALRLGVWDQALLTPCTRSDEVATLAPGYVELTAQFVCGDGELSQEFRWLQVLPPNFRVVLGSQLQGESQGSASAQGNMRTLHVPRPQEWKTQKLLSVALSRTTWLVLAVAALAALAFALRRRPARWVPLGLILFLLGFWLVERFLA